MTNLIFYHEFEMLTFKQKLETQELGVHGANFITIVSLQKISLLLRLKKKRCLSCSLAF